jgi:hypothetical protein
MIAIAGATGPLRRAALSKAAALICSIWLGVAAAQETPEPTPQQEKLSNMEQSMPSNPRERFYRLSDLAAAALDAGEFDKAQNYANELLADAPQYSHDWNYGSAIFYGNIINGRVALARDQNVALADSYLSAAGRTPGSPGLDSFGPDMNLAKDLLAAGERTVVLDFLEQCRRFWKMGSDRLSDWISTIKAGGTPAFTNLGYSLRTLDDSPPMAQFCARFAFLLGQSCSGT